MSTKVKIGISSRDPNLADAKAQLRREEIRANDAVQELRRVKRRIREFYAHVDYVAFPETAPDWAPMWKDWLLSGDVPKAEEPSVDQSPSEPGDPEPPNDIIA